MKQTGRLLFVGKPESIILIHKNIPAKKRECSFIADYLTNQIWLAIHTAVNAEQLSVYK